MAKHGMFDFTNRIIGFDLLRSIAIFYVFWGHGEILVPNELKWIYSIPMIIPFEGVSLFFVLSGFLIGVILNRIDISEQRARRFTSSDLAQFDKIYALANDVLRDIKKITGTSFDSNKIDLLLNEQFPGKGLDVPDPYYGEEADYHDVYSLLDEVCSTLIEKYGPRSTIQLN